MEGQQRKHGGKFGRAKGALHDRDAQQHRVSEHGRKASRDGLARAPREQTARDQGGGRKTNQRGPVERDQMICPHRCAEVQLVHRLEQQARHGKAGREPDEGIDARIGEELDADQRIACADHQEDRQDDDQERGEQGHIARP